MRLVEVVFFLNDTATTEIYTLSLHDALPISRPHPTTTCVSVGPEGARTVCVCRPERLRDRKSTRLNSSHQIISYAVFCLKKKKTTNKKQRKTSHAPIMTPTTTVQVSHTTRHD